MKVVKYHLTAQIIRGDKEEKIERKFRHLKNAKEFVRELTSKGEVKCGEYSQQNGLLTRECNGEKLTIKVEIRTERIKKIKKEKEEKGKKETSEEKKEASKEEPKQTESS
ncbi:hypothetical protein [Stygiolobus caldivivus]|uniref:Uncharacterized protein n=1 Tax=Stygiolobus caldivivus TaxID=2824673 RepID=A0A8D5U8L8_9CREN|nr:hypothetical protein [Stygiolobus caldivivus]BCU70957.1 hypothetical protein KN1_22540 [Stygiolobus caldivivus]